MHLAVHTLTPSQKECDPGKALPQRVAAMLSRR
jgi:hypothetical protein